MVENNYYMEREKFLISKKSCEECPKMLTKESCTYCKFFLLFEREHTNIYDNVDPNLDEFYDALEQDTYQIIDVEASQEDLLKAPLEENVKTEILKIGNDKITLENSKKSERKLKKLHFKSPVISAIKKQGKRVLDLTVRKRREIIFLNGIENASVADILLETSLSATQPEKDLQEKTYSDMTTTRIRKKIAKFARIKLEHASRPLWDNANTFFKSIGIICLLCAMLLPRYLWSPELKFTRDFSFLNAIILWTSFFVLSFCAIFFLKLLLMRKKKAKPKILCKVSLIRSLRAFRSNLESKGLKFYKQRKSTQYFFEYMEKNECNKYKKIYIKENLSADTDDDIEADKPTIKLDLFDLIANIIISSYSKKKIDKSKKSIKKISKSKKAVKVNSPKLRVIKSEIIRFGNALTSYENIEGSNKNPINEWDPSITIPAASKEGLKRIKALNKEINPKTSQIVSYRDMESREEYENELVQKYEEKKQAESLESIRFKKEKENYSKSDSENKISS